MPDAGALIASAVSAAAVGSMLAAGDTAVTSLPAGRVAAIATEKPAFARYSRHRDRILSRWLAGRVLAMAAATALLDEAGAALHLGRLQPVFAVCGAALLYGTLAEILNTIARRAPEAVGAAALGWLRPIEWLVAPFAEPLALVGRFAERFAPERPADARLTETEIATVVDEGEKRGALERGPAELIRNVLEFKHLTARDAMVPRARVSGIDVSSPLAGVRAHVAAEKHSRYPVYRESLDHVVGLLYAKDLFQAGEGAALADLVRDAVLFVTESQPIATLLREMRAKRMHMAVVTDEFGGTAGIVTLEDILEEIVGDIRDEHEEGPVQHLGGGRVVADASISLEDLALHINRDIPTDGDYESLGGLVVHRIGHVPAVGATVRLDGLELIVREADQTRVVKVEIVPAKAP